MMDALVRRSECVAWSSRRDPGHPVIHKLSILPGADMICVIDPAWKDEIVKHTAATFKPSEDAVAGVLEEFELNGPAGPLLDDDCARPHPASADEITDLDLDDVTASQLAVDREIEHRAVA